MVLIYSAAKLQVCLQKISFFHSTSRHCKPQFSNEAMLYLGEIAVLILASLWLVEGQPGTVRTTEYDVLRNYSGQNYPLCFFIL